MNNQVKTLTRPRPDTAPWLYEVGPEVFLDLRTHESREDWLTTRIIPMLRRRRLHKFVERFMLLTAALAAVAIGFGAEEPLRWIVAAVLIGTIIADIATSIRYRSTKKGTVTATRGTPMYTALRELGMTLNIIRTLREEHINPELLKDPEAMDRVDPDALEDLSVSLLKLKFPHVDVDYIQSVQQDVHSSFHNLTGLTLTHR